MSGAPKKKGWMPTPPSTTGTTSQGRPDPCDIDEQTVIMSPIEPVVTRLRRGDLLSVRFHPSTPNPLIRVIDDRNEIAGTIAPRSTIQLLQCLQEQVEYVAEVIAIEGGLCRVRIRRRA